MAMRRAALEASVSGDGDGLAAMHAAELFAEPALQLGDACLSRHEAG